MCHVVFIIQDHNKHKCSPSDSFVFVHQHFLKTVKIRQNTNSAKVIFAAHYVLYVGSMHGKTSKVSCSFEKGHTI